MTTPQTTSARRPRRQPLPAARTRTVVDPRVRVRARRRRAARRLIPAVALVALFVFVIGRIAGDGQPASASEIGLEIRDQVTRDIIARTEDYSATVGPLDCVALQPGKGNCLADVKLAGHRSDNVMVAVSYTDAGGGYDLVIKMP